MSQPAYFHSKTGFLPSVKIKPVSNLRNKKQRAEKMGIYCRAKLRITEDQKNVPELIEDYYRRFKMQNHQTEPLSVSINFKEISQSELEADMAKSKQEKLRAKSSKNKNRTNSEGSYLQQLRLRKESETQKIKIATKMILNRLKSVPNSQICREDYSHKNQSLKYEQEQFKQKRKASNPNLVSKTIDVSHSKKYFMANSSIKSRNQMGSKKRMSAFFSLCNVKKSKQQVKTMQKLNQVSYYPEKMPSPWHEEQTYEFQLPHFLQQLQSSIQL